MNTLSKNNPVVLRVEHGHPGYADHQVIATRDTMRTLLSDVLRKLDAAGENQGRVESVECTLANERSDHVYVSFHTASKGEVERYHTRLTGLRARKALRRIYHLAAFFLALYGLSHLLRGL